ncbi:hypothetical protein CSC27_0676 [Pseudomonas aeruginosa]|nr:hypothetical protein CSC27_0676 [Pseudomonas aeruginosa]
MRPFKGAARPAAQCATCRNEKAQLEGWALFYGDPLCGSSPKRQNRNV